VSFYHVLERLLVHKDLLDKIVFSGESTPGHFESFQDGTLLTYYLLSQQPYYPVAQDWLPIKAKQG